EDDERHDQRPSDERREQGSDDRGERHDQNGRVHALILRAGGVRRQREDRLISAAEAPAGGRVLLPPELGETTARFEQLLDAALLDDAPGLDEDDAIGRADTA